MPRSRRYQTPFATYHVLNRGQNHQAIAFDNIDFEFFEKGLIEIHKIYSVQIYAYCLMTNHFHLLLRPTMDNFSRAMRHFSHTYVQRVNRRHARDGPLFKGRFKSILVGEEGYFLQVLRYIHLNPVTAKIVARAIDYPWSSARRYFESRETSHIHVDEIFNRFDADRNVARAKYQDFIEQGNRPMIEAFYARQRLEPVIESEVACRALGIAERRGKIFLPVPKVP